MKIKRMKGLLCLALVLIMCVATVTTTMAILKDMHEKEAAVIKFGKVAIMADDQDDEDEIHGSNLSVILANSMLSIGSPIINAVDEQKDNYNENGALTVKAAEDTEKMYIRVKLSFSFSKEIYNETHAEALAALNSLVQGEKFVPFNGSADGYEFIQSGEWYYLVVSGQAGEAGERQLVTVEAGQEFTICEYIEIDIEEEIFNGKVLPAGRESGDVYLNCEVQAIQAEGISDKVENAEAGHGQVENPNNLVVPGEGLVNGGITVSEFEKAMR